MASVTFEHLTKTYPNGFVSVNDVNLTVEDGEFVVFHGPSGCGKSTILRMVGGLEDITSGKIWLGKELLNDILPRDRRLAMAFQNYTLYKHFNVYDNMALGLRLRDLPRNVIDSRVKSAASLLGITGVLDKKLRAISDAEKQRVALGRAIVCQPKVLLVDEDFARQNDDRRHEMISDILKINERLGITVLYVTNDYDEVCALNKKTVFMKEGKIVEVRDNPGQTEKIQSEKI
ncbi:sugar ABC transporter ATP-binding protein [Lachnoclostridium sp. An169]|uniref:ABC transporter ATP-binding protein n=1 Tax=Lachnoclostridium sp. An169 TaxID=1965569 RepID=UPI000B388E82|nr:ABC transporter ATP-binding protein [Lachnoclostridium sp. An169]OUP82662.1 sugar ABC transporter ATP-binding protein [Lachnoclostridium sp. An169]HJA65453.1 ABC transporter ATP-binding protein [Candidatus Mediterraneibacter cottocaccae]